MALLDICVTEGDSRIVQIESRGNTGTLTDICVKQARPVMIESRGNVGTISDILPNMKVSTILFRSLEVSHTFQS